MKHLMIVLLLIFGVATAQAKIYTDGLSDEQIAELNLQVVQLKKANKDTTVLNTQQLTEYAEVGANIGKALAGAARELGVEANKFAQTPVGMLTVGLIVFHFFGETFIQVFGGLFFMSLAFPIWIYSFRKIWRTVSTERILKDKNDKEIKEIQYLHRNNVAEWVTWHWAIGGCIVAIWCMITFI